MLGFGESGNWKEWNEESEEWNHNQKRAVRLESDSCKGFIEKAKVVNGSNGGVA